MRRDTLYCASVMALFGLLEPSAAFVSTSSNPCRQDGVVMVAPLHLIPGQGNQLVAAYNAATCKKDQDDDDDNDKEDRDAPRQDQALLKTPSTTITVDEKAAEAVAQTTTTTSRNFVKRAFSLPSHKIRRHPHPKAEGLLSEAGGGMPPSFADHASQEKDVVYFPLVGFTFCKNGDRVIPLPTQSNVSCRLRNQQRKEELYGWFSPVCKLDLYSDDPCRSPEVATTSVEP